MSRDPRPTLLLSDLHLPNTPSPLRDTFLAFLAGPAREAQAVWILGDLFEYWIGDAEGLADYRAEADALRALADSGVRVRYLHGNRDFLVGRAYAEAAGFEIVADPLVVDLHGTRTLLSHGDLWCTDDLAYQRWRRFSRNPLAQAIYRRLPKRWRLAVAGEARAGSSKGHKPATILDVNPRAVEQAFVRHGIDRIIHGHTHRPARHAEVIGHRSVERIVLADWHDRHCEYLRLVDDDLARIVLPTP